MLTEEEKKFYEELHKTMVHEYRKGLFLGIILGVSLGITFASLML